MSEKYSERFTIRCTASMKASMEKLARDKNLPSHVPLWREGAKKLIENEADEIGSRRHFSRTMNAKLDEIDRRNTLHHLILMKSVLSGFGNLMKVMNAPGDWSLEETLPQLLKGTLKDFTKMEQPVRQLEQHLETLSPSNSSLDTDEAQE